MAGFPLVANEIQQPPSAIDQYGKVLALRDLINRAPLIQGQQQLQQQQLQSGALGIQEQQMKLQSQKAIMDAIGEEYRVKPQNQQPQGAQPVTQQATAPPRITSMPSAQSVPPTSEPINDLTLPNPAVQPSPTPGGGAGNFLSSMQRVISRAAQNGAIPSDILGLSGQILTQQKAFADMSKTQQDMAIAQNKNAGDLAEKLTATNDPVQQAQIWRQEQQALLSNPNASSVYGPGITSYILNSPYPGPDAINAHLGSIQAQSALLADQKTQLENKKLAPFSDTQIQQSNAAINSEFMAQTGKPAPPQFLLQPGDTQQQFDNISKMKDTIFSSPAIAGAKAQAEAAARLPSELALASYNKNAAKENALFEHALNGVSDLFVNPQHGYSQTLSQLQATKNSIASAKDGSELAASMAPLMTALGVTSFAGVHRINNTEVNAAGPQVGSIYRQINSVLDKAVSGKLQPDTAQEMSNLMDSLASAKYNNVLNGAKILAANGGIDPKKVMVMDQNGKPTLLSQAQATAPAAQEQPVYVNGKLAGYTTDGKTMRPAQ